MLHDLHALVHTLGPPELDFVRKYSQLYSPGRPAAYMVLFEKIAAMPEWNEKELREAVKYEPFFKHLTQTGTYLEKLVLRCRRNTPSSSPPYSAKNLYMQLMQAGLLAAKGIVEEAARQLADLELVYTRGQHWSRCLIIARFAIDLEKQTGTPLFGNAAATERLKNYLRLYKNEQEITRISSVVLRMFEGKTFYELTPAQQRKIKRLMQQPVISDPAYALSVAARADQLHLACNVFCYFDNEKYKEATLAVIALLEQNPDYAAAYPSALFNAYYEVLEICRQPEQLYRYEETLQKMLAFYLPAENVKAYAVPIQCTAALRYYGQIGDIQQTEFYLDKAARALEEYAGHSRTDLVNILYYNAAEAAVKCGLHSRAVDIINESIAKNGKTFRPDVLAALRYLQVITHYQMGNHRLVESLLRAALHFTEAYSQRLVFDDVLLRLFRRLANSPTGDEEKEALQTALHSLQAITDPLQIKDKHVHLFWQHLLTALLQKQTLPAFLKNYYQPFITKNTEV